jgi:xanthine/uracil permease
MDTEKLKEELNKYPEVLRNLLMSGVSLGVFSAVVLSALFQIKNN